MMKCLEEGRDKCGDVMIDNVNEGGRINMNSKLKRTNYN